MADQLQKQNSYQEPRQTWQTHTMKYIRRLYKFEKNAKNINTSGDQFQDLSFFLGGSILSCKKQINGVKLFV